MLRAFLFAVGLWFATTAPVFAADPALNTAKLNKPIEGITGTDLAGKTFQLCDWKDKKAIVVVFLSFECPVSNSYATLLTDLAITHAAKGVAVLGVLPTDEALATLAKQATDFKLNFPILPDPKHTIADSFKATVTPEVFVLDRNHVLRYRGRIDNTWAARLKKNQLTTTHELTDAVTAVLDNKPVAEPATIPIGCPLPKPTKGAAATPGALTYHTDILPILQAHCQSCHRAGQVGPFALMTYKQAVHWSADLKEYTHNGKMPPWKPVAGPAFHNDRRMPPADIAKLAAWVDAGCVEGDAKDAPPPAKFTDGWALGQPDLVLNVDEDMTVGPSGSDLFRCFVLPTGLKEDKYIVGLEVKPGNPRVVHHTLNFFDGTGQARKLAAEEKARKKDADETDYGPGYSVKMGVGFVPAGKFGGLGGWAPGQLGRFLPEGTGFFLPANSDLVIQTHYHRTGRVEKDRITIGLYFNKKAIEKPLQTLAVRGNFVYIPPFVSNHVVKGGLQVTSDCTIYNVMPHMHLLGKKVKVTMIPPGEAAKPLVAIDDWDYNWQETYTFKQPIKLKAGTWLEVEAVFDNSASNPNNPAFPPRPVLFGEQTTNEMLFGFIGGTNDSVGRITYKRGNVPKAEEPMPMKPAGSGR
jgi:peroxiredoxin